MFVNYETSVALGGTVVWINSLYVVHDWRSRGVFNALYADMVERDQDPFIKAVRLYVETTNQLAQGVYTRKGMRNIEEDFHFWEIDLNAPPKILNDD